MSKHIEKDTINETNNTAGNDHQPFTEDAYKEVNSIFTKLYNISFF